MKKYVIYSAMVGGYDDILQPLVVDNRFDYILFCNEIKQDRVGVWQIRRIDYYNPDNTRICRYVKTHPHELVQGYDFSIWMDSNVQICTQYVYDHAIDLYNQGVQVASMWHPVRNCIYQEAFAVVNMMVEHEAVVVDWCHKLREANYPRENGLCETAVMYRVHYGCLTREADALWWLIIDNHSRRDQLSFNYVLWKLDIPLTYFFGKGLNARNTEHMRLVTHKDTQHNNRPIKPNEAWLMRYCWKNKNKTKQIENLYYRLYALPFPKIWFALFGQIYRIKYYFEHKCKKG